MCFNKITKPILLGITAIILIGCLDTSSPQDIAFQKKLDNALRSNRDFIKINEIYAGNWTRVCPVVEYDRASSIAAIALGKKSDEINITNTKDEVASGKQWGLVFLYPPAQAEYIRISNFYYMSGGCESINDGYFEFHQMHDGSKSLRLIAK